jgi:hypothetical protein
MASTDAQAKGGKKRIKIEGERIGVLYCTDYEYAGAFSDSELSRMNDTLDPIRVGCRVGLAG